MSPMLVNPYRYAAAGGGVPKRTITIDHTKVGAADSTDFPVLISGTYAYLKTTANGGSVEDANGYDVGFFSDSGLTTRLKHQTERYIATTGEVVYWVKVPTVSASVDTVIYMAYGDPAITTDQSDAANVWDASFQIVQHYRDGSSLSLADSTSNARNGTGTNSPTAATGLIDGGMNCNSGPYVQTAYDANGLSALTVEFWAKTTSNTGQNGYLQWGGSAPTDTGALIIVQNNAGTLQFYVQGGYRETSATITTGVWNHYAVTKTAGHLFTFYRDGLALPSTYAGAAVSATFPSVSIGTGYNGQINAVVDELRVSSTARSASWLLAEYNNAIDPSTFYAVGAET